MFTNKGDSKMPTVECDCCGSLNYRWIWEEAFDKFGFNDGDGQVEAWQVESVLAEAGYEVTVDGWGMHNTVITSLKHDGVELIPHDDGQDHPFAFVADIAPHQFKAARAAGIRGNAGWGCCSGGMTARTTPKLIPRRERTTQNARAWHREDWRCRRRALQTSSTVWIDGSSPGISSAPVS